MYTLSGDKIPVSVLIAPKIAPPIQYYVLTSFNNLPHVMGIKMAHPVLTISNDDNNYSNTARVHSSLKFTCSHLLKSREISHGKYLMQC